MRLFIYSIHSVWFRFAMYENAVLFFCTLALSVAATVANIKIRYDAKTPKFAIFGTSVICVFYSNPYAAGGSFGQYNRMQKS